MFQPCILCILMHLNILLEMNNSNDTGPGLCTSASNSLTNLMPVISLLWVQFVHLESRDIKTEIMQHWWKSALALKSSCAHQ